MLEQTKRVKHFVLFLLIFVTKNASFTYLLEQISNLPKVISPLDHNSMYYLGLEENRFVAARHQITTRRPWWI
jgi:hypothetical protein